MKNVKKTLSLCISMMLMMSTSGGLGSAWAAHSEHVPTVDVDFSHLDSLTMDEFDRAVKDVLEEINSHSYINYEGSEKTQTHARRLFLEEVAKHRRYKLYNIDTELDRNIFDKKHTMQ